jgi:hypothetical protein
MLLCVLLLIATPSDDALRQLERRAAEHQARREESLRAIERAARRRPLACPACDRCPMPLDAELEARVPAVKVTQGAVSGVVEVWRVHPPPPTVLALERWEASLPLRAPGTDHGGLPWWAWVIVAGAAGTLAGAVAAGVTVGYVMAR